MPNFQSKTSCFFIKLKINKFKSLDDNIKRKQKLTKKEKKVTLGTITETLS